MIVGAPIPLVVDQRFQLVIWDGVDEAADAVSVLAVAALMFVPEGQPSCRDAKDKKVKDAT